MSHFAASCVSHCVCVSECVLMSKGPVTNTFEAAMLGALVVFSLTTHTTLLASAHSKPRPTHFDMSETLVCAQQTVSYSVRLFLCTPRRHGTMALSEVSNAHE